MEYQQMDMFVDRPSIRMPRRARVLAALVILIGISLLFRPVLRGQGAAHAQPAVPAGLSAADWQALQAMLPADQQDYLKASNTSSNDYFGGSVAVDGDTVVVGAWHEDSSTAGVNSTPNEDMTASGAAYVFVRSIEETSTWTQQAYLKASNPGPFDTFGVSVAVDGDTIVIGASNEDSAATEVNGDQSDDSATNAGAAYVFVRDGTTWTQQAYLKTSNAESDDQFGVSVAVDGDTAVIGAFSEDSAATGVDGDQSDNSMPQAGAAYVFVRTDAAQGAPAWTQEAYLKASNPNQNYSFGVAVAVDGDTVVVGSPQESSSSTGVNSTPIENAGNAGAAYVFVRSSAGWAQQAYLKASNTDANDAFGISVEVDGDTIVIGAPSEQSATTGVNGDQSDNSAIGAGAAYAFVRDGTTWTQQAYLKASNTEIGDQFGRSVTIDRDTIVVSAPGEASAAIGIDGDQSDNSMLQAGAAYTFVRARTIWIHQAYLKASNTGTNDLFGYSVDIDGDTVVIGAMFESSAATGVNGDQADDSATLAGAAYISAGETFLPPDTLKIPQYLPFVPVNRP